VSLFKAYRDPLLVNECLSAIHKTASKEITLMEVCGGHTNAIHKFGIRQLLPENISLLSGPGCPVCVTNRGYIDQAIFLAKKPNTIICTYGDLIRVPGTSDSLESIAANGASIQIILSPLQALETASLYKDKEIIFLGIGFETTAPASAAVILQAKKKKIGNISVMSAHKTMPNAMQSLAGDLERIDGFICPGHVAAITGSNIFNFLPKEYNLACAVSGFEPLDLLESIILLIQQINSNKPQVAIQYKRAVSIDGNIAAQRILNKVFTPVSDWWRGLGKIPASGLGIKPAYESFDTYKRFYLPHFEISEPANCACGEILKGNKSPNECKLFGKACTPENPIGACMVSNEGACLAHYKYKAIEYVCK